MCGRIAVYGLVGCVLGPLCFWFDGGSGMALAGAAAGTVALGIAKGIEHAIWGNFL